MFGRRSTGCALVATLLLAACGGDGATGDPDARPSPAPGPAPAAKAEGVYEGTTASGWRFRAIVLENDELWALYGLESASSFAAFGMVKAQGTSDNGSWNGTGRDYAAGGQVTSATVTATYVPRASFDGSFAADGTTTSFTSTGLTTPNYVYDTPATLAAIVGAWIGTTLDGTVTSVTVASDGALTGNASGCAFTGTIAPRASGKNVYDVSLAFGGPPCVLAGQTASGIGISYLLDNGLRQLVVGATNAAGTAGTAFFAVR